jgi:hypothetical protein
MKLKDIFNQGQNKNNKQYIFNLRKKELRKIGMTPKQIMNIKIPIPENVVRKNITLKRKRLTW